MPARLGAVPPGPAARPGPGGPREVHTQPAAAAAILAPRLPTARDRPRRSTTERIERVERDAAHRTLGRRQGGGGGRDEGVVAAAGGLGAERVELFPPPKKNLTPKWGFLTAV